MNSTLLKITLCFTLVFNITIAQNKLQYTLEVGDSLKISQIANQDIIQDMNGSKHEMKNLLESDYTFVVAAITDSSYMINFKFDKFKLETTSNLYGTLLDVDTSKEVEDTDLEGKIFSGLILSVLKMEMLKTGKIKEISGTENMIDSMISNAGIEDEFTKQLMIEAMKKEFGDESLSKSFEQMTFIYPNKEVEIGESWTNRYYGDMECTNVWTLNALGEYIDLSSKSDIKMNIEEDSHTMSLEGTQDTVIKANKSTGFATEMEVISEVQGITIMSQMKSIEIPTTINSTTTYKIEKHVQ